MAAAKKSTTSGAPSGALRVVIYDRVSETDEASQAEHLRRCHAAAEARGWEVVHVEAETVSGYSRKVKRPGWERVEGLVRDGSVDVVLVFALSRAGRNLAEVVRFAQVCDDAGVTFASATEPIDSAGAYGKVILAVLASVAEIESAMKRERALLGRERMERDGLWTGGRRPFGWTVEDGRLVPCPTESALVRQAVTDVLNGKGLRTVANAWNDEGVTTTAGNAWRAATVRTTLLGAYHVPEVLTESDRRRLLEVIDSRRTGKAPERYPLSGLVFCAEHGERMVGRAGAWVCLRGGSKGRSLHLSVKADQVILAAADAAARREAEAPFVHVEAADPSEDLVREAERIRQEMRDLGRSTLPLEVLQGRADVLAEALQSVEERLAETAAPDRPADFWEAYTDDETLVRQHVERIEVRPGKPGRYPVVADRLDFVWRAGA